MDNFFPLKRSLVGIVLNIFINELPNPDAGSNFNSLPSLVTKLHFKICRLRAVAVQEKESCKK